MKTHIIFFSHVIASLFFLMSCETPAGHSGVSGDIAESKKRGVFISEYGVNPNPYRINDSLQITVKEAWLERQWRYGKTENKTLVFPPENYQLCINTVEKDIKSLCLEWTIGTSVEKSIRTSNQSSLMGDFQNLPGDTIEYAVQQGTELSKSHNPIIIGKFVLIRKRN